MKRVTLLYPLAVLLIFILFAAQQPAVGDPPPQQPAGVKTQPPGSSVLTEELPVVGSAEKLKSLLKEITNYNYPEYSIANDEATLAWTAQSGTVKSAAPTNIAKAEAPRTAQKSKAFSSTNVQVKGVDEADVVKTDGKYIYQVNNRRIIIVEAYPPGDMKIIETINFADNDFRPMEIYVDDSHLLVIGHDHYEIAAPQPEQNSKNKARKKKIMPPIGGRQTVKAMIYDIIDKENAKKLREVELEGHYISSRKIGAALYLVANKHLDYYYIMENDAAPPTPLYRDSAGNDSFISVGFEKIRYFPVSPEPNYLLVAGLNLDKPHEEMQVSTYLGSGQNLYASENNLYIAVSQPDFQEQSKPSEQITEHIPRQTKTILYRFALTEGRTNYTGKGEVPGTILNQFSMDEHDGYFRIATTLGEVWAEGENAAVNNIFVLDNKLKIVGKLEGLAPGERIYSTRFMGDRLYMVTFKKVDPLFVIDLKNPEKPQVLGELKIPGYSDYLHPYDENHIIGFGKDTEEADGPGWSGDEGSMAFYQGMKIAIFDVTDVTRPVEKFKEIIGARGTDSELLRNHKALLFDKEKNLLAFPITLMEARNNNQKSDARNYGEFAFQGAYVYNLDITEGFKLKGRITHLTGGKYPEDKTIERILYIDDTLYTLSQAAIKANEMATLNETDFLSLQ